MKRLIYPILILLVVMGCKEVFEAPPQALLRATFYDSATKRAMNPVPIITVQGVGNDSILNDDERRSDMLLPLTSKDTTYYNVWLDSIAGSMTFVYQTTRKVASVETGFYYEYKLLSVNFTHSRIDSLTIVDSLVTIKWNENIKLYIQPLPVDGN